jgi:hypothetical protein
MRIFPKFFRVNKTKGKSVWTRLAVNRIEDTLTQCTAFLDV